MEDEKSYEQRSKKIEFDEVDSFDKSLKELKGLRAQLHYAADYCETAFLKTKQKQRKRVMENTKDYISKAMVTVVDHLGSVSANLDCILNERIDFSQAEIRIDCLNQRLRTCQYYTQELNFATVLWSPKLPRHHQHYISPSSVIHGASNGVLRAATNLVPAETKYQHKPESNEKVRRRAKESSLDFKKANPHLATGFEFSATLPVSDGPSILVKPRVPSFRSQFKVPTNLLGCNEQNKKAMQGSNFLPFLRRSTKTLSSSRLYPN